MFYSPTPTKSLRLGDIVAGLVWSAPKLKTPISDHRVQIEVAIQQPALSAILTPCCSIERKEIVIAPLIPIRPSFLDNPYFKEDLARLNATMTPEQTLPPHAWKELSHEAKLKKFGDLQKPIYAFLEVFVYAPCDALPAYKLKTKEQPEVRHYMISFKHISKVECESIARPDQHGVDKKLAELSAQSRDSLRRKLAQFYGRVPEEDLEELGLTSAR